MRRLITTALLAPLLMLVSVGEGRAKLLLSKKDALGLAFPTGAKVERKTAYLSKDQVKRVEKRAHAKMDSSIWIYYVGESSTGVIGYAYFDRIIIRTLPATVMAVLDGEGRVRFVEILTFSEPADYLPRRRWLGLFKGRGPDNDARVQGVSGATLTAHSLRRSVDRILAVHEELYP